MLQPAGHLDQQLVAGLVPGDVVDGLEPVEVEHQQAALGRSRRAASSSKSCARLGSRGQVVGVGHPLELALAAAAGGDVAQVQHPAVAAGAHGGG